MAETEAARVTVPPAGAISPAWKRIASSIVLIPVFVWVTTGAPAWVFQLLVVAASAVACRELARMFERTGRPIATWLTVGVGAALTASFATSLYTGLGINGHAVRWMPTPELALLVGVGLICSAPLWSSGRPLVESTANTLFGAIYIGWLLGYAIWLQGRADGPQLVLFLVGVTWAGESAAYLVGSSVGRRRLAPVLSPGKTVEGAIGGVLGGTICGLVFKAIFDFFWPELSAIMGWGLAIGFGLVLSVAAIVGDLIESLLKRDAQVKDAGAMLPGMGGILDRIDSPLLAIPVMYYMMLFTAFLRLE